MSDYYFDLNAPVNGNGSLSNPYNNLNTITTLPYPYNVYIKRGSTGIYNITLPSMTGQTQLSTISSYGDGPRPVLKPLLSNQPVINSTLVRSLKISDIDFVVQHVNYTSDNLIYLRGNSEGTNTVNLEISNCEVRYKHPILVKTKALYVDCIGGSNITYRNDNILVKKFNIYGGHWGVQVMGGSAYDLSNGKTDAQKARNVLITECTHIDGVGDGFMVLNCDGQNKAVISKCIFRSNAFRQDTTIYTADFWLFGCVNASIEYCEAGGTLLHKYDKMGFDLDGKCINCWVRYCISYNNGGGFCMFVDTTSDGRTYTSTDNAIQVLVTEQQGNVNCGFEYCLSYNDGIGRGGPNSYGGNWMKISLVRNIINGTIRNCTFIDTINKFPVHVADQLTPLYDPLYTIKEFIKLENNPFYYSGINPLGANDNPYWGNGMKYVKWTNTIMYDPVGNGASYIPDIGVFTNMINTDPKFGYLGETPPSGIHAYKTFKLQGGSSAFGTGSTNTTPDIWGKTGNNIGWQQ